MITFTPSESQLVRAHGYDATTQIGMIAADAMSERMKRKLGAFVPRQKLPGEAPPATYNIMDKRNKYSPPPEPFVRPGANDHLKCKSVGVPT